MAFMKPITGSVGGNDAFGRIFGNLLAGICNHPNKLSVNIEHYGIRGQRSRDAGMRGNSLLVLNSPGQQRPIDFEAGNSEG